MKRLVVFLCIALLGSSVALAKTQGKVSGGMVHSLPEWFKESFLNFNDDVDEAKDEGRHILVFMDLNGCPYCARMLQENFYKGKNMPFIKEHFDTIALNIRGSREVVWIDQETYTEKALSIKMKVVATPTMIFLSPDGKKVLQLNGYRSPETLRHALEFVHSKAYNKQSLAAFIEAKQKKTVYTSFRDHPSFKDVSNFAGYKKPSLIIFEDKHCADCNGFHDEVMNKPDVLKALKAYRVVRLDAYSDKAIVDFEGKKTTPRKWAAALKMDHRPGLVMFDEGKEASRLEGRFYHFHFKEMLRFVSGKHYKNYDRFGSYLQERQTQLLDQGIDINLSKQ